MYIFNIYTIKFWQSILAQERVEEKCCTLVKSVAWEDLLCHLDPRSVVTRGGHWESCYLRVSTLRGKVHLQTSGDFCAVTQKAVAVLGRPEPRPPVSHRGFRLQWLLLPPRPPPVFLDLPFSYSRHTSPLLSWGQAQLLTSMPASMPVVLSLPTVLTLAGFLSEMGHIRSYGLSPVPFRIQPLLAKVRLVMDDRQLTK